MVTVVLTSQTILGIMPSGQIVLCPDELILSGLINISSEIYDNASGRISITSGLNIYIFLFTRGL